MRTIDSRYQLAARQRGISLVETVLALLILGGAFVSVLNTIGSARAAQAVAGERQVARVLAEDLMAEILAQTQYEEGNAIGRDSGESGGDRVDYDDIDDYDDWSSNPPEYKDGTEIAGADGYTREVTVRWVNSHASNDLRGSDDGVKRIVVTVRRGNMELVTLTAFRTDSWTPPEENY